MVLSDRLGASPDATRPAAVCCAVSAISTLVLAERRGVPHSSGRVDRGHHLSAREGEFHDGHLVVFVPGLVVRPLAARPGLAVCSRPRQPLVDRGSQPGLPAATADVDQRNMNRMASTREVNPYASPLAAGGYDGRDQAAGVWRD